MSPKQQTSKQLELHLVWKETGCSPKESGWGAEGLDTESRTESLVRRSSIIEKVVEEENIVKAIRQVKRNGGSPGIDGMTVKELPEYLKSNWPRIKGELLAGSYTPSAVRRAEIPKANGGRRKLGISTVLDRFIQQSILQVLQEEWDRTFSEHSYGFRPKKSAHQAVAKMQEYMQRGKRWVVDIDLEKFFDRVNHDKLMGLVAKRISDKILLKLIRGYLNSGVMEGGLCIETKEGTPQGGPLSPLLSNLMLDVLDKELERRNHSFVRYADDCNIYVGSQTAGERVMESITQFLRKKLKLKVNQAKSAVARPWKRKFLGFTVYFRYGIKRKVSPESIKRFKNKVREITSRTRGISLRKMIRELARYLKGWIGYYKYAQVKTIFRDLDRWIRRRLRSMLWKQWGRRGYRELLKRGISRQLAWNTCKSAHGPWRLSHSPALSMALPVSFFDKTGLPQLKNLI